MRHKRNSRVNTRVLMASSRNRDFSSPLSFSVSISFQYPSLYSKQIHDYASIHHYVDDNKMVLKNRSKSKSKSRSNGHTQIPTQLVIPVQKRRTHHTDKSESENEDETGIENDGHDRNELLNIWRSFPTTVPHLLAFLNLVYAVLISSIIKFEIGARETIMGLTDWLSSRGVTAEGDRDGTERLGMMERMPGEDVTQAQARRDGVENKQIRRRRHEIQERAGESLFRFGSILIPCW